MHHQWLTAPRIGHLTPIFCQEVTPGDTWSGSSVGVFRLAPLDVPAYMSLSVFVHFFFVPHTQTFPEFGEVITGEDTTTPWPTINYAFADYEKWHNFGVGSMPTATPALNAMPVRAFNQIINKHFLNLSSYTERTLDDISQFNVDFPSNDYFGGITTEIQQDTEETINTAAATVGITEIRDAWNRQNMKERRARYGKRYVDLLASMGVRPSELDLDRPTHCARGKTTIGISEVVATATSASENTGEYRGHGIGGIRINFPKRYFSEYGILMGVMYARPRFLLRNRIDKQFLVTDHEDLYHPELAGDTQVVVDDGEIRGEDVGGNFGYQRRYEYLRTGRDTIAKNFALAAGEPWTSHVDLSSLPSVAFLQQVQDYDHIFQDQTSTRMDLHSFFDHKIGKKSIVKRIL